MNQDDERSTQFSKGYRVWLLVLLILIYATNFMDRIIVATVGQAMKVDLNLSDLQLGLLGGMAFAFFYAILGIPMARLSERVSRVKMIAICAVVWSGMTALCGAAQNYVQLLLFRIGVGVGEAGGTPASHSLIADHFPPRQRATAFSLYALGTALGSFAGAFGAGYIVQTMGWRAAFVILGLPGVVLGVLAVLTLREPKRGLADGLEATKDPVPPLMDVVRLVLRKRSFIHVALGCALIGFANFGINMFMPIYFHRIYGLSYAEAGLAFGLITGLGAIVGTSVGGFLCDWAGKRDPRWYVWVVALVTAVSTPFYLSAFLQSNMYVTIAILLVFGSAMYVWYGSTFAVAYSLVTPRMRASVTALMLLLSTLIGQGLGPIFIGGASDVLTRRNFDGDYATACVPSQLQGAADSLVQACAQASATGLRSASILCGLVFLWGALHYYLASHSLRQDQET